MRVSEAAAAAEVTVQALRYYERRGLFPIAPRRNSSGYRDYDVAAVQRVRFIKRAQDVGFSLDEIRELLELRDRQASGVAVRRMASAKIEGINDKLQHLTAIRDLLVAMVDACRCTPTHHECPIIEVLDGRPYQISRARKHLPTVEEECAATCSAPDDGAARF